MPGKRATLEKPHVENIVRGILRDVPVTTRALVGVSGGRDSVVLLDVLVRLGFRNLVVCHLDHGIRPRAASADARFVAALARRLRLDARIEREEVPARAKQRRQSLETAARGARYDFFARAAREQKCRVLFLGHHADDQVETFLFNLFRGAGASGLGAMRAESRRTVGRLSLKIVRPLLGVWREEIDEYVREKKLKFREDSTNRDMAHARNSMRHRMIPFLEKSFGRSFRKSIWRTASILAAENEWMESMVPAVEKELSVSALRPMPPALQRRLILRWLVSMEVPGVDFEDIEQVRSLLKADNPAKVNLPRGMFARRRAGKLFLE